jgi:hypothetical protein
MLLSEKVEAHTGGDDWALRVEIAEALGWTQKQVGGVIAWYSPDRPDTMKAGPPKWLTSLDAAMTLIPDHIDEWEVLRSQRDPRFGQYQARLEMLPAKENRDETGPQSTMNGATPAIALTAAALRSRGL